MTTHQYKGTSIGNFKAVRISPGAGGISGSSVVSIGLGAYQITNVGFNATLLALSWNSTTNAMFQEILATANEDGSLLLTHNTAGEDFEITASIDGQPLQVDTIQLLSLSPAPSGGTYTLSDGVNTSAPLAWNADAATIQAAIEAMTTYTAGDVLVSGAGTTFSLDFGSGRFGGLPVAVWTVDSSSLTGGTSTITIGTTQNGSTGQNAVATLLFDAAGGFDSAEVQEIVLSGTVVAGATWQVSLDSGATFSDLLHPEATGADLQIAVDDDSICCFGQAGGPYRIFFGDLTNHPAIQVQINQSSGAGTVPETVNATLTEHAYYNQTAGVGSGALTTSDPWQIGNVAGAPPQKNGFLRFTVPVPQGRTITTASFGVKRGTSGSSGSQLNGIIKASAADDVTVPADGLAATSASMTTAASGLSLIPVTGLNGDPYVIDVTTIIQETVNRGGFVSGNHVGLNFLMSTESGGIPLSDMTLSVVYLADAPTDLSATVTTPTAGGHVSSGTIDSGLFNLTIIGATAGTFHVNGLDFDSTAAEVQSAIVAVCGASSVVVTGGPAPDTLLTLTFGGPLQKQPITLSAVASFGGDFSGAVTETTVRTNNSPPEALNVWDLTVCPGQGTLGIDPDTGGAHNFIVIKIVEPLTQLPDVTHNSDSTPSAANRNIYVRLYDINSLRIQRAINEAYGADVCRVTRVTHSHEWARVVSPDGVSVGFSAQAFYCWYYRDVFRVVFVNRFAEASTITSITVTSAPVSPEDPTPTGPDAWLLPGTLPLPAVAVPWDLAEERSRLYIAFTSAPLHIFSATRCLDPVSNLLAYKFKLAAQYGPTTTVPVPVDYSGITTQVSGYTIKFTWTLEKFTTDGDFPDVTALGTTVNLPWNAAAGEIQAAIEAIDPMFVGNVFVTGSLYNSWKPEGYTDLDDGEEDYDDLLIQLNGWLSHLPFNEKAYSLQMSISNLQYQTDTSYTREITALGDVFSVPLPTFKNLRQGYRVIDAANTPTYQIIFNGTAQTFPIDTTPAALETALNNLFGVLVPTRVDNTYDFFPSIFGKSVKVYGVPLSVGQLEIEFLGHGLQQGGVPGDFLLGSQSLAQITTTTPGLIVQSEIETILIVGSPHSGSYTLTATPGTTGALAYNANAAAIQTALRLLTGYGAVVVSGNLPSFIVTFPSALGNVVQLSATPTLNNASGQATVTQIGGARLVIEDAIPGRGPGYLVVNDNYDTFQVFGSGDVLVIENASTAIRFGIDLRSTFRVSSINPSKFRHTRNRRVFENGQKVFIRNTPVPPAGLANNTGYFVVGATDQYEFQLSTTLGGGAIAVTSVGTGELTLQVEDVEIQVFNRYTGGQIGLPNRRSNAMLEYLATYVRIPGMDVTFGFNADDGNGVGLFNGDASDRPSDIVVNAAASSLNGGDLPPLLFLFNNEDSTLVINDGDVGIAVFTGQTSLLKSIIQQSGTITMTNTTLDTFSAAAAAEQRFRHNHINETIDL